MIRAVLLDVDGTLLDTEGMHFDAWKTLLEKQGKALSRREYLDIAGKGTEEIADELIRKFQLSGSKTTFAREKESIVLDWFRRKPIPLMPYAVTSVRELGKILPLAAVSGAPRSEVVLKLQKTLIYDQFKSVVSMDDVKRGKPAPDMYQLAVKQLKVKPEECIAVEDTEAGVASATGAGVRCLAIPNDYTRGQDFSKAVARLLTLQEAVSWILKERTKG